MKQLEPARTERSVLPAKAPRPRRSRFGFMLYPIWCFGEWRWVSVP